ncbi:MAG: hypothetical protein FWC03_08960 [Treponema sp.]|nr:hypothetical protein [Treponema sp.]
MDDRKKRIDDLDRGKMEAHASLDTLLENFGENLYFRTKDMQAEFDDILQYNTYLSEISESSAAILKVEEKNRRFKELEETIEHKEQEEKERSKEMAGIYRRLGRALLANKDYNDFTSLFREQADATASRLESLEIRIKELENKEGGNVFSWIGKSAQGLVLKSFLSKAQDNQEQLYKDIGERYCSQCQNDPASVLNQNPAKPNLAPVLSETREAENVEAIFTEIDWLSRLSRAATDELSVLKDEKRIISAGFGIDGNPQKQVQTLTNHIAQIKNDLRSLYRNFGAQASGILDSEILPERKYFIDTIVTAEDGEVIGRAVRLNQSIVDYEKAIGKLKASLAIDEENSKIEKFMKSIEDKKKRITDLQNAILDLEENVHESERSILELKKQL